MSDDGSVLGSFKKVSGYTGFSDNPEEQSGYYFPFKLEKTGEKMTFKKNGVTVKDEIGWEEDNVFRVTSTDIFEVIVDGTSVVTFNFKKAQFEG